ncbi:MAG: SMC-Scp complex subunit ScpB [Pirellulales bacterium]
MQPFGPSCGTLQAMFAARDRALHPLSAPSRRRRRWPCGEAPGAAREPMSGGHHVRSDELARLEAALFLAREPLSTRRLAKLARLSDGTRARVLLRELRQLHDAAGSAFRVEQIAGGYQLLTRGPFGPWVRRLHDQPAVSRLSAAALETLAIVAYRQPVTRAEIESIRGVGSEEMLRQLLERDLVAVGGRAEDLGRPNVYVTTRRFLAAFGLARIEDLPPIEAGSAAEAGDAAGQAG